MAFWTKATLAFEIMNSQIEKELDHKTAVGGCVISHIYSQRNGA